MKLVFHGWQHLLRQCKKAKQTDSERRRNKKNLREERAEEKAHYLGSRFKNKTPKTIDMKTFTESMLNQCRKYMFNFFDYLPTKYQQRKRHGR